MSLPKPVMRGLLGKRFKFLMPFGFIGGAVLAVVFKFRVAEPRKKIYDTFYKEYDSVKEFNTMREAGVFESVRPTGK